VALINTLGLTELVSDALASRKQKEAETNDKIVDLFKDAFDEIKNCRTEQQRVEFHIALTCVMSHRVDEDVSGLTFEEWDPSVDTDTSGAPVAMIVNSSELRTAGFDLREVIPLQLEEAARGGQRTRGADPQVDSRYGYQEVCTFRG
jgi:hypothetical protein